MQIFCSRAFIQLHRSSLKAATVCFQMCLTTASVGAFPAMGTLKAESTSEHLGNWFNNIFSLRFV